MYSFQHLFSIQFTKFNNKAYQKTFDEQESFKGTPEEAWTNLHPSIVLSVEETYIVQRSVGERVSAEEPQGAAPVSDQGVTEARQHLA